MRVVGIGVLSIERLSWKERAVAADSIDVERQGDVSVVRLIGDHDVATRQHFVAELENLFQSASSVVIDLTDADFVDSTVIAALVAAHGQTVSEPEYSLVVVVAPGSRVERVLALVGLGSVVPVFSSRAEGTRAAAMSTGRLGRW
jgi:anti-anti-sigma factor